MTGIELAGVLSSNRFNPRIIIILLYFMTQPFWSILNSLFCDPAFPTSEFILDADAYK